MTGEAALAHLRVDGQKCAATSSMVARDRIAGGVNFIGLAGFTRLSPGSCASGPRIDQDAVAAKIEWLRETVLAGGQHTVTKRAN